MLHLDLDQAAQAVKKSGAKIVAVQVPEGLKQRLLEITAGLEEKSGARVFAFVDPCYGACDAGDERAKALGADLLLHFGHTQFLAKHAVKTVFLPMGYKLGEGRLQALAEKLVAGLKAKKLNCVALCSTAQFLGHLEGLKAELGKRKIKAIIGNGRDVAPGQVLGCNYSAVKSAGGKADAIVFLGDGLFHPLGISFCTEKPVFVGDPLQAEARQIVGERDLFLRRRMAMIENAKRAQNIAIWVSSKRGQQRMQAALKLKKKLEAAGKRAFVFVSDLLNPDYLLGVQVDAIVCTACPRIALDDAANYRKPVLNPGEMLIALGEKEFSDYKFEELGF